MMRSRLVVSLGAGVVGAGVLAALGALYLDPARAAVGPLPGFGLLLPADARFVVGIDVQRLTASPFYQRMAKERSDARPDAFGDLERKTGLQPERDLDRVLIAGRGASAADTGLVLVQGRFDRTRLSRALETEGKQKLTWKDHAGTTLYLFNEAQKGARALAFLAEDILALGSASAVEAALDARAQGRQPLRDNPALLALLERVKAGSTIWMVGDQSLLARMPSSLPAPGSAPGAGGSISLPGLTSLVVSADVEPQLAFEVVGEAADEQAARNMADVVRGFVALLALQAGQKPELKDLAAALSVASEANRVRVSARIPHELLEALHPKRAGPASQATAKP